MLISKQQVKQREAQTWNELSTVKAGLKKSFFVLSVCCFSAVNIEYVIKHRLYPLELDAS